MRRAGLALLLALPGWLPAAFAAAPCPVAAEVTQADLLGAWQAVFDGSDPAGTLRLEPHPQYAGSFTGTLERGGERRRLAGDVDEGDVTLEESADGVHIAAAWIGEVVEGSCGREIRGTWKAEGAADGRAFLLRRP
jgi:hypothetical protein